jgi:hypothetical protein
VFHATLFLGTRENLAGKYREKGLGGDSMSDKENDRVIEWVYSRRIRLRNGKVIYASSYGLKAFRFPVRAKKK